MKAIVDIDAGICGFKTRSVVTSENGQHVVFEIESDCERIRRVGSELKMNNEIDAYEEISAAGESVLLKTTRNVLTGCCAGCAVPAGLFKAMQVTAGLALPKDIIISLNKE
jgi:hypothetical protein